MANVFVNEQYLTDIADSIRDKLNTEDTYKVSEMADAIDSIGGGATLGTKTITTNGTYDAEDDELDGYSEVDVSVANSYSAGDEGKVVSNGALVSQTSDTVTTNDTYDTTLINSLTVNVSGGGGSTMASGTYTPQSTGTSATIDTGLSTFTHFLIVATTSPLNNSVKAGQAAYVDFTRGNALGESTNNSGTSAAALAGGGYGLSTIGGFTKNGSVVTLSNSGANFSNLISGVTYDWFAW